MAATMNQMKVMQDVLTVVRTDKELSEKMSVMETIISNLLEKYCKLEQDKMIEIQAQVTSVMDQQKTITLQQDDRLQNCERMIQTVSEALTQLETDKNMQLQQTNVKEYNNQNEELQNQSPHFTQKLNDVMENIQELNTRINHMLEYRDLAKSQFEAMGNRLKVLEVTSEDLSTKVREQGLLLEESKKGTEETEVKHLLSVQKDESEKLQKLEEKISASELNKSEVLKDVMKFCQDWEKKNQVLAIQVKLNLVIIGKVGEGKSATGNTLLGRKVFKSSSSLWSETKAVSSGVAVIGSYKLNVVDTPGLEEVDDEYNVRPFSDMIDSAIALCDGVDAFLYVIKFGHRFTEEDMSCLETLKSSFGDGFMKHVIVVLTGGDTFHDDMKEEDHDITFEEWCKKQVGPLRQLYDECQGRVVLFNNRERDDLKKWAQVQQIIELTQDIRSRVCRYTR